MFLDVTGTQLSARWLELDKRCSGSPKGMTFQPPSSARMPSAALPSREAAPGLWPALDRTLAAAGVKCLATVAPKGMLQAF